MKPVFFLLAISVNLRSLPFKVSCFWRALPSSGRNCILPLLAHNGWGNFHTFLGNIYCPYYMYSKYVAENSLQLRVSEKRKVRGRTYSNRKQMNIITINVPLIFKMRDIIFLWQNYFMGHFKRYFEGAKTFLTPKLSRVKRATILGMNLSGTLYKARGHKITLYAQECRLWVACSPSWAAWCWSSTSPSSTLSLRRSTTGSSGWAR